MVTAERRYTEHFYRPEAQSMLRSELALLQNTKLRQLISRVWHEPITFFKRKMETVGLRPEHIRTVDELKRLTPTVKEELAVNEEEFPPYGDYRGTPLTNCIRLGRTTGTTGKPSTLLWTKNDYQIDAEISARSMKRGG